MMMNAPCYGCDFRQNGCHADCEKYKEFRQAVEDFRKMQQESRDITHALQQSAIRRCKSRKGKRGNVR